MVTAAGTLRRPRIETTPLWIAGALAFVAGHAVVASRFPVVSLGLAVVCAFAFSPRLCRAALIAAVALGPTINPTLFGLGANNGGGVGGGRVYALQALCVFVILGGTALAARNGLHHVAAAVLALVVMLVLVQTVGRPHAGPAWIYRPFQLFLLAFATRSLFTNGRERGLLNALAWGSAIGCTLASVNALIPSFDPFAVSRPDNIPFVSAIGSFARATGAFTYPNNLGTFAAYSILLGVAALLLGRPALSRGLARFVVGAGMSALLLSGSRAAGVGLLCGVLYLTFRLAPRRRALILAVEALVGLVIVLSVLSSRSALEVAQERVDTAAGLSLSLRQEGWRGSYEAFRSAPIFGTGATEARTDGFWLLYLSQGGIVGAALFLLLGRTSLAGGRRKASPELWVALLIALCTSGLLQDSLGQTLATWFPGVLLGLCALPPRATADAQR